MHVSDMSTRTSHYGDITLPLSVFNVTEHFLFKLDVDIRSSSSTNTFKRNHSNYMYTVQV